MSSAAEGCTEGRDPIHATRHHAASNRVVHATTRADPANTAARSERPDTPEHSADSTSAKCPRKSHT